MKACCSTFLILFASLSLVLVSPATVASQTASSRAVNGRRLFNQSCAGCHDALGTARRSGPGLKNYSRRQPRPSDAAVRTLIREGRGRMPGFGSLHPAEVDDLVAYLKTL